MKKLIISLLVALFVVPAARIMAQDMADLRARTIKEYNVAKRAKKEAKEKKKQHWEPYGGSAMIEDQIFERILLSSMTDKGRKIYLIGPGTFISDDPGSAIKFARERAIQFIAGSLEQKVAEAVKVNTVVDKVSAKSLNDAKSNAMSLIEKKLTGTEPIVMMIREAPNKPGYYEATVVLAYDRKLAEEEAAKAILNSTKTEDPVLQQELMEAMDRLKAGEDQPDAAE